jgi:hypothetical protein
MGSGADGRSCQGDDEARDRQGGDAVDVERRRVLRDAHADDAAAVREPTEQVGRLVE